MAIGYACQVMGGPDIVFSTLTLAKVSEATLESVISNNLDALEMMIKYSDRAGLPFFRISSDIIPLGSHPANTLDWQMIFGKRLAELGGEIQKRGMRVSMHPGQYTVLNSPKPSVVESALSDLIYHSHFLDAMGLDHRHKLVLHIGGVYGDKAAAMARFIENYERLPVSVQNRLVLENDERCYNIADVLYICEQIGAPAVFDNLHHELNPPFAKGESATEREGNEPFSWILRCRHTWQEKDGVQKIHYAQQRPGGKAGSHSETIQVQAFINFINSLRAYGQGLEAGLDIMLEVKDKNLSALKCRDVLNAKLRVADLEQRWAQYKYQVLSRSSVQYQAVRELLKNKAKVDACRFYTLIEMALAGSENVGAEVNAAQHIWGYVNDGCSAAERAKFHRLLGAYQSGEGKVKIKSVRKMLLNCAKSQEVAYLLNSYYFYKPFTE